MNTTELLIQSWNIFGVFKNINGFVYNKLQDPDFIEHTQRFHIFGLIETQHTAEDIDKLQILGYKCFQVCRKKKRFGRKHGGLAVYVHLSILPGVSKIATDGSETIILKLKKDYFKLRNDTLIYFSYCVPSNSSFAVRTQLDPFSDLEQKISNHGYGIEKIILGDLNARPGLKLDYLENEDNSDMTLPSDYMTDTVACYPWTWAPTSTGTILPINAKMYPSEFVMVGS